MDVAIPAQALLGEGPRWDARSRRLLWVDIEGRALHVFDPASGHDRDLPLGSRVGSAAPMDSGGVLVALADRLAVVDLDDGSTRTLVEIPHGKGMRLNDGACDPAGRFWVGSMALDETPGAAALYRFSHGSGLDRVLDGVTLSNGLGWSRDGTTMYYVDSPTYRIDAFDVDVAAGEISGRRQWVAI
ncbi:MAG: SMP-30/gluconolactonase/LRE family protein, partial [Thermoleophilia bacterium]|nr:SMP-30/gluconolactonase/LRE family protein [Thermoleophilia bacterium]